MGHPHKRRNGQLLQMDKDNAGGIKLKEHKLFVSKEDAEASIPKTKPK